MAGSPWATRVMRATFEAVMEQCAGRFDAVILTHGQDHYSDEPAWGELDGLGDCRTVNK